jgi:putative oxidoreductase
MELRPGRLLGTRAGGSARLGPWVRVAAGAVFIAFGVGKFSAHGGEVDSFRSYGLPSPDAFVYVIGVLEVGCGAMLVAGLLTRVAAALLAGDMLGAIAVSGIGEGEVLPSLTLAPALLLCMIFLLVVGPGSPSLDTRLVRPGPRQPASRDGTVRGSGRAIRP